MSDAGVPATAPAQQLRWHHLADAHALQAVARDRIIAAADAAISARGRFVVVLSGGNTPRPLYESLRDLATDWSAWTIWFGDERCVPADDPERNSRMTAQAWLDHVGVSVAQVHVIRAELGAKRAALEYTNALHTEGEFDMVLLGLGEDGHTASLFPGHDWGVNADSDAAVAVFDAPKPPPERVSLSASRLSRAREVLFLASGESKREAIQQWRRGDPIPASAIRPAAGVDVLVA